MAEAPRVSIELGPLAVATIARQLSLFETFRFIRDLVIAHNDDLLDDQLILWLNANRVSLEQAKEHDAKYKAAFPGQDHRYETWGDG